MLMPRSRARRMMASALASVPKRMWAPPRVIRVMRMPVLPRFAIGRGVSARAPEAIATEEVRRKSRRFMAEVYTLHVNQPVAGGRRCWRLARDAGHSDQRLATIVL